MRTCFIIICCFLFSYCFSQDVECKKDKNKLSVSGFGFIENKGQFCRQDYTANSEVEFLFNAGNGLNVQLRKNGFSYDTYQIEYFNENKLTENLNQISGGTLKPSVKYKFHRIDIELIGSNSSPQIISQEKSSDYLNYYTSSTSEKGITGIYHYKRILYKDIYPGIDLIFEALPGSEKAMEYFFIVHPGADASLIKLHYSGADSTSLEDGKISLSVNDGKINESIPDSWLMESDKKISVHYSQLDKNIYGFDIPEYDKSETLIIDPTPDLDWGTYFGTSIYDWEGGVSSDSDGNIYMGGESEMYGLATAGAFQTTVYGSFDGLIAKFDTAGSLLWCTYYGGGGNDDIRGISVDNSGNPYIGGFTESSNIIASTGAYQVAYGGSTDAFVSKFSSSGMFLWGTYFGGSASEWGNDLVCQSNGSVYLTGFTRSASGIATSNAYQSAFGGDSDAFLAKFDSNGGLSWSTYYGGTGNDVANGICLDENGSIFIAGATTSTLGIATAGAFQTTLGGDFDALIARFDSTGSMLWGTYFGGNSTDKCYKICCDIYGNLFVAGLTVSSNAIASSGAHQTALSSTGKPDGFLAKFNTGGTRVWATYYGGTEYEYVYDVICVGNGNPVITGQTNSTSAISTANSLQVAFGGTKDGFIAKFNNNGVRQWGTYYGGSEYDFLSEICTDVLGNLYLTGVTESSSAISTVGSFQPSFGGDADIFLIKINNCGSPDSSGTISGTDVVCSQISYSYSIPAVSGATSYLWQLPSGAVGTSTSNLINITFSPSFVTGNISVSGLNSCGGGIASSLFVERHSPDSIGICYVEFDTIFQKNRVIWPTMNSNSTDSITIYCEQALGVWTQIGKSLYADGSFIDFTSNPMSQSYNYKITSTDSCGFESVFSQNHKTITLFKSYDQLTNTYGFTWSPYEGLSISQYDIYGVLSNGTAVLIGSVPGNSYMFNYPNPSTLYLNYFVGFNTPACDSSKLLYTVRSNYVTSVFTGLVDGSLSNTTIYPNPVVEELVIEQENSSGITHYKIFNTIGLVLSEGQFVRKANIPVVEFCPGVYFVCLYRENEHQVFKFVKE